MMLSGSRLSPTSDPHDHKNGPHRDLYLPTSSLLVLTAQNISVRPLLKSLGFIHLTNTVVHRELGTIVDVSGNSKHKLTAVIEFGAVDGDRG